jgi:hypothetical protein
VELAINTRDTDAARLKLLQEILLAHSGKNPVYLRLVEPNGEYILRSREIYTNPSDGLLHELRKVLGENMVSLVYHPRGTQETPSGIRKNGMQVLMKNGGNGSNKVRGMNAGERRK